ncbi:diaminopimelate decarboxylase [Candidatus Micrarchaeota archaeon]|nr:diaminopimelate decarboxylase [Candidatus Micrarchaeota archaeon]MBI5176469.1 diaminopimelate decarboxylase [Candidatus Micrarchaeota archaeon]
MLAIEGQLENRGGTLFIDGCSSMEIAGKFGTPVYVMSESRMRENYRRLKDAFARHYSNFRAYYAVKANNNLSVLSVLRSEGAGADCSAPSEIALALKAGFSRKDLLYTGNYNSLEELKFAGENGVTVNLDDAPLLEKLAKVAKPSDIAGICFRFNPGLGRGGMEKLVFAGPEVKFGISEDRILGAYARAKELGYCNFGIHMMTGSNVLDAGYFPQVAEMLFRTAAKISREVGIEFGFINIGGGFGVPYRPGEVELDVGRVGREVTEKFKEHIGDGASARPQLLVEPGRYFVCDAGVLLARVHHVKNSGKRFIGTDAGMNTLLRPAMYGAYHVVLVANNLNAPVEGTASVVGQICENTDHIARDRPLPAVHDGDLIAVLNAGAYGFGMSSQYNSRPRCAEVMVNGGQADLIRERENVGDLIGRQSVPDRLL